MNVAVVCCSGTAVAWRITAGASTGSLSGIIGSLEIPELKVTLLFVYGR